MRRPDSTEHDAYYSVYVDRVPQRPVLEVLAEAPAELERLLGSIAPADESYAYDEGKWSIREALGHVVDTERIFSQRALHIARCDPSRLPGMDQDQWAEASNAADRPVAGLLAEFRALRTANVELFSSFNDALLERRGMASGFEFSVRALVFIVAGHELHHRAVFVERYLSQLEPEAEAGVG